MSLIIVILIVKFYNIIYRFALIIKTILFFPKIERTYIIVVKS